MTTKAVALGALAALCLAGCGGPVRPAIVVSEIPPGEYQADAFIALAPTLQPDGEVVAAVLYTMPGGRRIEVRDSPRWWLWERALGRPWVARALEAVPGLRALVPQAYWIVGVKA